MVWECQACSYIYDGKNSDEAETETPESSLNSEQSAGIPADWVCPVCGVGSEFLEEISGRSS